MSEYLFEQTLAHLGALLRHAPLFGALLLLSIVIMRRRWLASARQGWPETRTNLVYMLVNRPLIALIGGLGVSLLGPAISLPAPWSAAALPYWAQIPLVIVTRDFVLYWQHRVKHHPWLWPFHAVHHSDTHLTWMTQLRRHPVDGAIANTSVILVLSFCGFESAAVVDAVAVVSIWGYLIHMRMHIPLIGEVLITPAAHNVHHVTAPDGRGHNFGILLSVWDRIFGTYKAPGTDWLKTGAPPLTPAHGWAAHMAHPFLAYAARFRRARRRQRTLSSQTAPKT